MDAYPKHPKTLLVKDVGDRNASDSLLAWALFWATLASRKTDRRETCIAENSSMIPVPYSPSGLLNSATKNGKNTPVETPGTNETSQDHVETHPTRVETM
jgi:hypothetical protein